jgi:hypothetical protein
MNSFNINNRVQVQFTEYGKQILDDYYKKLYSSVSGEMTPQSYQMYQNSLERGLQGEFSLWEIMHIFGPVTYIGNPKVPFVDNSIQLLKASV